MCPPPGGKVFEHQMARQTRARASNVLMSPRKVRLVLDLVRGKYVDEAVAVLGAVPNRAARVVEKVVQSAAANGENNLGISRDSLVVAGAFADGGPTLKRIQPRAMGRAYRILKRTSHVTVILEEAEPKVTVRKLAKTVTRADAVAPKKTRASKAEKPEKPLKEKVAEETIQPDVQEEVTRVEEPTAEAEPQQEVEASAEQPAEEAPAGESSEAGQESSEKS